MAFEIHAPRRRKGGCDQHEAMQSCKSLARSRLDSDARITVLTGAGVSAASGVPTFRGADGLWKNFRPETLATAEAFGRDPRLVWEWYAWRRLLHRRVRAERRASRAGGLEPALSELQVDHAERRRPARVRLRQGYGATGWPRRRDSPARLDLGSELLAGLREVADAVARRHVDVSRSCRRAARIAAG